MAQCFPSLVDGLHVCMLFSPGVSFTATRWYHIGMKQSRHCSNLSSLFGSKLAVQRVMRTNMSHMTSVGI